MKRDYKLDNIYDAVVEDFGKEWEIFDQRTLSDHEREAQFKDYFSIFPWPRLGEDAVGFDAGCGSGRWAQLVAPKVGHLHCVDPSKAIEIAQVSLKHLPNCSFHRRSVGDLPFLDNSMDFGYSLGVLHHIPDTQQGLMDCVRKLKPKAPFLVYLYYALENQPGWFRVLWSISDIGRYVISRFPHRAKYFVTQMIAACVYWPLARFGNCLWKMGFSTHSWPLSAYRNKSFYWMRTDALDRFGTKVEKRFTRKQIQQMMENAGLEQIEFSQHVPYWCALGFKK